MLSKIDELNQKINMMKSHIEYINSMVSILMSEANLIDLQIEEFTRSGLKAKIELRDLKAELKDTI